ncbi:M-phase inducer phosphatase 2 isoform 1 [Schistosoma japonicum]|uniref:M-phase inducer phosphatase 2 isoform 1 n=3 Tax=Schistosoma japonicum TaxID=6182 RepID=A0A4Z2CTJ1_SCHJA|nr:M-phase inducer phosphatase 2 isoform 1 [Schistosoma japonicum]
MNKSDLSSDTPVTRLSKILSKANILEVSKGKTGPKLHQISEIIPADIDESANQEPPTTSLWSDAHELLIRESSNSCSSGYYSSATTRSAPASCICEQKFHFYGINADNDPSNFTIRSAYDGTESLTPADSKLRRAHSCSSRGWLAKRHIRQQWPRISGISRDRDVNLITVANTDTNSCPAVITHDNNQSNLRRYSLPPVGELGSGSTSDDSSNKDQIINFLASTKSPSPQKRIEFSSSLVHPMSKKQRMESPEGSDLNSTISTGDLNEISDNDNIGTLFTNTNVGPKPFFELLRHHSTPMPSYSCKHCPSSPVDVLKEESSNKPKLPRCLSEMHPISYDAIARCIGSLSNHSLCSDGRRARALPVVDRTGAGLHCVSTDTVADLVSGSKRNINYVIVDCRFPYEYEGGHIKGAINIFTHCDLVQEIFNRVPAQRPPGTSGPPRFLGEDLARRLAATPREPLSAPCELISDDDDDEDFYPENTTSEISDSDFAFPDDEGEKNIHSDSPKSEPDLSFVSGGSSNSGDSSNQDPPFVVIFHCEFSSQRAPALAAFLRNVDRVSNYHRYPFLYFPEIYVMKGGYSAFYRKFPHICTPQEYVKMFHRDYRNHLRLYKRLTRRVSSACLACIKPQNEVEHCKMPISEIDSYCQLPLNQKIGVRDMFTAHEPPTYQFLLKNRSPIQENVSDNVNYEDKENCSPTGPELCSESPSHHSCSTDNSNIEPKSTMLTSPCVNIESCNQVTSDMVNSPLGLAEVVVRVGRRVIAATLGSTDTNCSNVVRALDRMKHQSPPQTVQLSERQPPVRCLKRSLTVNSLDVHHHLMHPKVHNPFCGGSSYLQDTPSIRRFRTNPNTDSISIDTGVNSILVPISSTTSNQNNQIQPSPCKGHLSYHSLSTCSE